MYVPGDLGRQELHPERLRRALGRGSSRRPGHLFAGHEGDRTLRGRRRLLTLGRPARVADHALRLGHGVLSAPVEFRLEGGDQAGVAAAAQRLGGAVLMAGAQRLDQARRAEGALLGLERVRASLRLGRRAAETRCETISDIYDYVLEVITILLLVYLTWIVHSFKSTVVPATDTVVHEVGGGGTSSREVVVQGVIVEQSSVVMVEDVA